MFYLVSQLRQQGFIVHALSYDSVLKTPKENAKRLYQKISALRLNQLHLIGHSLGGIMILHLLATFNDLPKGRVVMLGTPIKGSWFAKTLKSWFLINQLLRNSMIQGLSGKDIPEWNSTREWGMIAGRYRFGMATLLGGLPEAGDGAVMIKETYHEAIKEHLILPIAHTQFLFSKETAVYIATFLNRGTFVQNSAVEGLNPSP
ncbi:MAG: hypothetical protein KAG28_02610 [Cocleimonas sp.]|nr:hypothetical protein [Cocleimonas sp.]